MVEESELNSLVKRRRAAAAARKAAAAAPVEVKPEKDLTPSAEDTLITERRKKQAASRDAEATEIATARTKIALSVRPVARDLSRQLSAADVVMPKLKISQAMSKVNSDDVVRQGNWYVSTTSENLGPEIYVALLDLQMSYSKFETGIGVVCRSFDLLHGEGDPGILCEGTQEEIDDLPANERGCPFRLWGRDEATGLGIPPKCGKNYNYPVMILDPADRDNGEVTLALWSLRSTASATAKLINSIVTAGVLFDPVWYEKVLKLTMEKRTNTRGTF